MRSGAPLRPVILSAAFPRAPTLKPQRTDSGLFFDLGVLFQEFPIRIDLESRLFRRGTMVTLTIPSGLKICLAKHDNVVMVAQTCRLTPR